MNVSNHNGGKGGFYMVQFSNGGLKTRLKKPVYGPNFPVFE